MERFKEGYLITDQLPIKLDLAQKGEIRMKGAVIDFSQEIVEDLRLKLNEAIGSGRPRQEVRDIIMGKLHISKERCKFIARQETALMTTKFKAAQYTEFGMDTYEWRTVQDKNVRHSHQILDRTTQDWNNPPVVDDKTGRRAQAGEDYNCFQGDTLISMIGNPIRAYKRFYSGQIIAITIDGSTFKVTPNHPILTNRGWVAANMVNSFDQLFKPFFDVSNFPTTKIDNGLTTAQEIYDFFAIRGPLQRHLGSDVQFHGDGSNHEINVINIDSSLMDKNDTPISKQFSQIKFANSNTASGFFNTLSNFSSVFGCHWNTHCSSMASPDLIGSLGSIHPRPFKFFRGTLISEDNRIFFQNSADGTSCKIKLTGQEIDAIASQIGIGYFLNKEIFFIDGCFVPFTLTPIETFIHEDFSGYVYNFETKSGLYTANNRIVSNCRCQAVPIVEW
jgi:hypothetical protein